ncbi:MAG: hypothetical protein QHG99_02980 [Methanomicrobiales archaeon]|nr:hypothetical protein [Methanomicrobiales archaeon]
MNPGHATNLISLNNKEYEGYACGGYQGMVLKFLHDIQSNPAECTLLNGYEFGPIEGSYGGHHAIVIYPEGTSWKETGTVLDPWYHQRPEYMAIGTWEKVFSPVTGDTSSSYRHIYPTTRDSSDFKKSAWTAAEAYTKELSTLGGLIKCPVDLSIDDASGKRKEIRGDGTPVNEIAGGYLLRQADGEGGYEYYFHIDQARPSSFTLHMTGQSTGSFEVLLYNRGTNTFSLFGAHTIRRGETATISFTPSNPAPVLQLPDRTSLRPIQFSGSNDFSALVFESRSRPPGTTVQVPLTLVDGR